MGFKELYIQWTVSQTSSTSRPDLNNETLDLKLEPDAIIDETLVGSWEGVSVLSMWEERK